METINKIGVEFFEKNPAILPSFIPVAINRDGQPWAIGLNGHMLFAGSAGSGKNSAIDALIRQLAPFIDTGAVKLYGIDPKDQLRPYGLSRLFVALAGGAFAPDTFEIIAGVHAEIKERLANKKIDLDSGNLGRSHEPTESSPATVLLIDELDSLLYLLGGAGAEGKAVARKLEEILLFGRSAGVYMVATTQSVHKDALGRMRDNFHTVVLFRQGSVYVNDLILGEGAAERGFNSTTIPLASPANNYETAGIAYARDAVGKPEKIRFAYTSDNDIAALIREYIKN
ncbi:FtsK/SpoIIIE domain-containing protein [Pseudoclavibacter terrae]|uniref:FtsK/SpoIIIE domain-containing protein n=1 Tax=Pseudoclavibacter terrae TaxID=1530195 RepID=UPI00232BE553|nr:FtsK/SpoIIIE domain-containing protein [Pseudoclavibacter terrae]